MNNSSLKNFETDPTTNKIKMLKPAFFSCGCFTGDTIVDYAVNNSNAKKKPIAYLYERWQKGINGKVFVRGKKVERVGRNEILDVKCLGEKQVVKLTFEDGRTVKCTPDHLFWTPTGWERAENMAGKNGMKDTVLPRTGYKQKKVSDPRVVVPDAHPYARSQKRVLTHTNKHGELKTYEGYSNIVELHRAMFECYINGYETLEEWKANMKPTDFFVDPKRYVVHHIDGDHFNNSIDNLCLLTDVGHKVVHSGGENGLAAPTPLLCVSVEDAGAETVYDIICDTYNSYTANEMVVHNCGSVTSRLASVLQFVGVPSNSLIKIRSKSHILARKWLEQENLYSKIPKLNNKVYGILIHPDGRFVDINDGAPVAVAKKFKEILNVSEPDKKS